MDNILDYTLEHKISTNCTMEKFHFHELYQIYLSLSDGINFFVNDMMYEVEKGDIFIFSPLDLHKVVVPPNIYYERFTLLFNSSFITNMNTEETDLTACFRNIKGDFSHKRHVKDEDCLAIMNLLEKAGNLSFSHQYGNDIYKKIVLSEILIYINLLYKTNKTHQFLCNKNTSIKVSPVIEYINLHYTENLSLDILSEKFFISKYYMENIFKSTTGFTINEYIIHKKIIKARELLRENIQV